MASEHKTSMALVDKDKVNQAQHTGVNSLQAAFKGSLYTQASGSDKVCVCGCSFVWRLTLLAMRASHIDGFTGQRVHS